MKRLNHHTSEESYYQEHSALTVLPFIKLTISKPDSE